MNDEPAILVCDYGKGTRPKIPFPYYAEAWTAIEDVRFRFDGERRNPWDEPECGHHYARAMSSWSTLVAYSGFHYHGADKQLFLKPRSEAPVTSFWSSGSAWGLFSAAGAGGRARTEISVIEGSLALKSVRLHRGPSAKTSFSLDGESLPHSAKAESDSMTLELAEAVVLTEGKKLVAVT